MACMKGAGLWHSEPSPTAKPLGDDEDRFTAERPDLPH